PAFAPVLQAWWGAAGAPPLPAAPGATNVYYLITIAHGADRAEAARAALMRDMFGLFAQGGTYFVSSVFPSIAAFFAACGFSDLDVRWPGQLPNGLTFHGQVLDLTRTGVDAWLDALLRGRPPARAFGRPELEAAVRAALAAWHDDARLAGSPLLQHASVLGAP